MRVGESRQLRGPAGDVERWRTDNPKVASVADEDLMTGRAGGLVSARAPGRARITAIGFNGSQLVDVDVQVEGPLPIRLAAGESATVPNAETGSGWVSDRPPVAEVADGGRVSGVSPGIAIVRGRSAGAAVKYRVEVSGVMEAAVNTSVSLASRFSLPVRKWRASSSAVTIDPNGQAIIGERPRTVTIEAVLEDGSEFTFDLRARRDTPPDAPPPPRAAQSTTPSPVAPSRLAPPSIAPPSIAPAVALPVADLGQIQGEQVSVHLRWAEEAVKLRDWRTANAELRAAEIAASGDESLAELARQTQVRLREQIAGEAGRAFERAASAVAQMRLAEIAGILSQVPDVADWRPLHQQLTALSTELSRSDTESVDAPVVVARIHPLLLRTLQAAETTAQYTVLPGLAELAMRFGDDGFTGDVVDALVSDRAASNCSSVVREGVLAVLKEIRGTPQEHILRRLSAAAPNAQSRLLQHLLADLDLRGQGRLLVKLYAGLTPPGRQLLVSRLAEMADIVWPAVFDLMTAVLLSLPADPRLAKDLRQKLGNDRLEQAAVKWASRAHTGASTILRRLYDYPPNALPR